MHLQVYVTYYGLQRNAKIHSAVGLVAALLGAVLRIDRYEWLILLLTITMVLAAEGVKYRCRGGCRSGVAGLPSAGKIAKDVGAGTVLLTAIASVLIGLVLFVPHLWALVLSWLR